MRRCAAFISFFLFAGALLVPLRARAFIITPSDPDPWLTTASGARPGGNGTAATITWSIVPDGTTTIRSTTGIGTAPSNLISFMNTNFGGNPGQANLTLQPWFHIFTDAFGRWSQLGGVNFVYEPNDDGVFHPSSDGVLGVRGDIRLAGANVDGSGDVLAFTYLPTGGSDVVLDTAEVSFFGDSTTNFVNFRNTLMHELGHTFGVNHVSSSSALLMAPFIDTSFDGPQLDEVRAVQYFFGDVNEKSNGGLGNGTFARATGLGSIAPGGTKKVGAAANVSTQAISPAATDFVSISNVDDIDFYSFSVSGPTQLSAMLTPRGGVFTQAPDGSTPTTFDADARSDLALAVLSTSGTVTLAAADANPAGFSESIGSLLLPTAGTYFARITGADDTIQLYELSLTATPILLGDYNKNGIVDTADYTVWRNSQGQSVATGSGADGDFNGQITTADYNVWRSHFGQTSGSGASTAGEGFGFGTNVPEPAEIVLLIGCVLAILRLDRHIFGRNRQNSF
jgi:hypothetical protein